MRRSGVFPADGFPQAVSRIAGSEVEYYPTLNEAFAAALASAEGGSLDQPDEIILLEDIILTESILIDKTRHIRLVAGSGNRTVWRGSTNIDNPLFRVTGEGASLCLGKPGMEHELVIDGGCRKNPPVRSLSPLIAVNGLDSKLIMYDKVTLQNNYNECAAPDPSLYQNGAGVFIRTLENKQNRQAEFIMKGGTIRGNVNNTQNQVPCGGGVFIAGFGLFTMEGGIIAGNTAYRGGGGFHTGSRGSFRKTGGIIYGYDAPEELQNRVIQGDGKPPIYGYAVNVPSAPPSLMYHGSDTTVTEDRSLTYTGAEIGQPVFFGENETWGIDIYNPPTSGSSFAFISVLVVLCVLLAAAIVLLVLRFLLKRKGAGEPDGTGSRITGMAEAAPAPAETEKPDAGEHLGLSPRETKIFTLLLTEASVKEIAYTLDISYSTVNFHIKNLYRKLGIQSRAELFTKFGKFGKK